MKVIQISEVKAEESTSHLFVGKVLRQQLIDEKMADQLLLSLGTFSPGARRYGTDIRRSKSSMSWKAWVGFLK